MYRTLLNDLLNWKQRPERKPLLLDGARQTGKTYLLETLLGQSFSHVLRVDFLENPAMGDAFADSLTPSNVITNLELLTDQTFNPDTDLLLLDEIGECPRAVTALKYFAEQTPHWHVAASGSNIGLLTSFPVGKVEHHCLRPLTFREFLLAGENRALIKALEERLGTKAAHDKLMDQLSDYYFTGGMPEAVKTWYAHQDESILHRIEAVRQVQVDLLSGYQRDFGKYAGKVDAQLIEAVFNAIPAQLSAVQDESVQRFRFKGVQPRKSRYREFSSAITWLHHSRLTLHNYPVEGRPRPPLAAHQRDNRVKLFLFDVGLLNHMLGLGYQALKQQAFDYKGFIAENFVQQELAAQGLEPTYSWQDQRAEIEFLLTDDVGRLIPVEVKSGTRTRARSLQSYITKCQPEKTIKLTGTQGNLGSGNPHIVLPLYFTECVPELIQDR